MRDASFWMTIYMVWLSALLCAWPTYAKVAWQKWRTSGGSIRRMAEDGKRFFDMMVWGKFGPHRYEPGQHLRLGITCTMGSSLMMAFFFGAVDRSAWSMRHCIALLIVVFLSHTGVMIHLYIAWRDTRWKWRLLLWAQVIAAPLIYIGLEVFGFDR